MASKRKRKLSGLAEPVLVREPLLVRSCHAIVNNLTSALKVAFILGVIFLAQDFRDFTDELPLPVAEIEPAPTEVEVEIAPVAEPDVQEPVVTERVKHFLNCTYEDYRTTHYDECVEGPSRIYQDPEADADDMGYVAYDAPVLLAHLDVSTYRSDSD